MKSNPFGIVLSISVCLLVLGCDSKPSPSASRNLRLLRIGTSPQPKSLDPRVSQDLLAQRMLQLVADPVLEVDEDFAVHCILCDSWHSDSENKKFEFRLKKDLHFSSGQPILISDVVGSIKFYQGLGKKFSDGIDNLAFVSANQKKERVIEITLKKGSPLFFSQVLSRIRIFPTAELKNPNFFEGPTGSGPLILVSKDTHVFKFKKNPYTQEPVNYDAVEIHFQDDATTRFFSLRKGDLDVLIGRNPVSFQKEALNRKEQLKLVYAPSNTLDYLAFNFKNTNLKDIRVRQAMALAIPYDEIIRYKFLNRALRATSLVPPNLRIANKKLSPISQNLNAALALMKQVGGSSPLELELLSSTDEQANSIQQIFIEAWKKIGIHVTLKTLEWGVFYDRINKGAFELYYLQWSNSQSEDLAYRLFHPNQIPPGKNRGFFSEPKMTSLLEQWKDAINAQHRAQLFSEVQKLSAETLPYIFLWFVEQAIIAQNDIQDLNLTPNGSWRTLLQSKITPNP